MKTSTKRPYRGRNKQKSPSPLNDHPAVTGAGSSEMMTESTHESTAKSIPETTQQPKKDHSAPKPTSLTTGLKKPNAEPKKAHVSIVTGTADPRKSYIERIVTPTRRFSPSPPPARTPTTQDISSCIIVGSLEGSRNNSKSSSPRRTTSASVLGGSLVRGDRTSGVVTPCDLDLLAAERHAHISSAVASPSGMVDRPLTPSCSPLTLDAALKQTITDDARKTEEDDTNNDTHSDSNSAKASEASVIERYPGLFPLVVFVTLLGIITAR